MKHPGSYGGMFHLQVTQQEGKHMTSITFVDDPNDDAAIVVATNYAAAVIEYHNGLRRILNGTPGLCEFQVGDGNGGKKRLVISADKIRYLKEF